MPHRFKALLFDLDGTLIDSVSDLQKTTNAVLKSRGMRELSLEEVKQCTGDGLRALLTRAFSLAGAPQDDSAITLVMPEFMAIYAGIIPKASCIYNGVADFLQEQKQQGIKLGLCTNKHEEPARHILRHLELHDFFDVIIGGDTLPVCKPDALPLLHALKEMQVKPEDSIMFGDSLNDALAAKAAGIPCIILAHGYGGPEIGTHVAIHEAEDLVVAATLLGRL